MLQFLINFYFIQLKLFWPNAHVMLIYYYNNGFWVLYIKDEYVIVYFVLFLNIGIVNNESKTNNPFTLF